MTKPKIERNRIDDIFLAKQIIDNIEREGAELLAEWRHFFSLNQHEAGLILGITNVYISYIENRKMKLSLTVAIKMAEYHRKFGQEQP